MRRIASSSASSSASSCCCSSSVLVAVSLLFDPNDYKDDITAAVQNATGRELTLDGDLELALFPTIRIAVGAATLSNAPGFGDEPMARIGSAELRLALLPLLAQRIEISQARLRGLELNLARNAQRRQQLAGSRRRAGARRRRRAGRRRRRSARDLDLGVGAIEIEDARIVWNDAATGSRWELTDFGLDGRRLRRRRALSAAHGVRARGRRRRSRRSRPTCRPRSRSPTTPTGSTSSR